MRPLESAAHSCAITPAESEALYNTPHLCRRIPGGYYATHDEGYEPPASPFPVTEFSYETTGGYALPSRGSAGGYGYGYGGYGYTYGADDPYPSTANDYLHNLLPTPPGTVVDLGQAGPTRVCNLTHDVTFIVPAP